MLDLASLDKWQKESEMRFQALAKQRKAQGQPVFALEHGYSSEELKHISAALYVQLRVSQQPLPDHWLLWIIYAAERGYEYDGGEYWTSFEEQTPCWHFEHRYRIKEWFEKFQRLYHGVKPTGPWAEHFSIIAWPITHAVLPRFLQVQFANILYELRYELAKIASTEVSFVGRLIASQASNCSSRFEQFLQQESLVGRIVVALMDREASVGAKRLTAPVLNRIIGDIERHRRSRTRLHATSSIVSERFKGLERSGNQAKSGQTPLNEIFRPKIRPTLKLIHTATGEWKVWLAIPNFKPIAALNPQFGQFLKGKRCQINGTSRKQAPGWLLYGEPGTVLTSWPQTNQPLLQFDSRLDALENLLIGECYFPDQPIWLFKIGRDGTARQVSNGLMWPDTGYILISKVPFDPFIEFAEACTLNCVDVHSVRVTLPKIVPDEMREWLLSFGFQITGTIRVWPVGLPARGWDKAGYGEWLTTEKPTIGICSDFPVDSFTLVLDGKCKKHVSSKGAGSPIFLQLSQLDVGNHELHVTAKNEAKSFALNGAETSRLSGCLSLVIKAPDSWTENSISHTGFLARSEPFQATLDSFWENEADITVLGSLGRRVSASVRLENALEEVLFQEVVHDNLELPVTPEVWKKQFRTFRGKMGNEWSYLDATTGFLDLNGGELGKFSLRFDNNMAPLRWRLRQRQQQLEIQLIDDSGDESTRRNATYFSFEKPTTAIHLNDLDIIAGRPVKVPGGLFFVQSEGRNDAIVVSANPPTMRLDQIGVTPILTHHPSEPRQVARRLKIFRIWRHARMAGPLAEARRQQVLDHIFLSILHPFVGEAWFKAEHALTASKATKDHSFDQLQSLVTKNRGFSVVLRRDAIGHGYDASNLYDWFVDLAKRYDICRSSELCRFALDLASRPHRVGRLHKKYLGANLETLKQFPDLVKAARFLALICSNQEALAGAQLPRWWT